MFARKQQGFGNSGSKYGGFSSEAACETYYEATCSAGVNAVVGFIGVLLFIPLIFDFACFLCELICACFAMQAFRVSRDIALKGDSETKLQATGNAAL